MRHLNIIIILATLLFSANVFAAQSNAVNWQSLLKYKTSTCPSPSGCGTDPKPPQAPPNANKCTAPPVTCGPGTTCCGLPQPGGAAPKSICYHDTNISDCCVVGNTYCTGGRICNYTLDGSGKPQFFIGCILPTKKQTSR